MIPTAGTQRIKRTVKSAFEYEKDGEIVSEDIRVEFYARTLPQIREQHRRNIEQSELLDERESLRRAMIAAQSEADAAKAALASAKRADTLTAQQTLNDKTKALIEATRAFGEKAKQIALKEPTWISVSLADILAGLPDLEAPSGSGPFQITVANLETLALDNLKAIEKAVEDSLDPKSQPSS